jgi:hypothetical protein
MKVPGGTAARVLYNESILAEIATPQRKSESSCGCRRVEKDSRGSSMLAVKNLIHAPGSANLAQHIAMVMK